MERRYERTLGAAHESVEGDLEEFADAFTHAGAPLAVPPFFALFDAELPAKTQAALADARNAAWVSGGAWGDRYRAALQLPSRRGLSALFVPRDVSAHIDRNILVKFDTTQDILGVGGSVGTAAQNLFGAFGVRPVFSFYQTDEFRQELSAAVALPKNDTASWRVNLAQSAGFFGFEGAELRLSDTMTLLSTGFLLGAAVEWISPVEKSLTSAFYDWVMRRFRGSERSPALASLAGAQYERVRKEKLQVDVDRSAEYARYALSAGHESIVRIAGRLELIVFITLSCAQDKQTETLSFIAVTGTSLRISF